MWFQPIEEVSRSDTAINFLVPNASFRDWISANYLDIIAEVLEAIGIADLEVKFYLHQN
jgi:chromosomal replication initiation ATPase DnaA